MIKVAYLPLTSFIKENFPDAGEAKKAAAIALGITVSRLLPLPEQTQQGEEHWATQLRRTAESMISEFNENQLVDVDLASETARGYWLVRYFTAYPCLDGALASNGEFDFLLKLTGGVRYLNNETASYCQANQTRMLQLINRCTIVLRPADADAQEEDMPVIRRGA